MSDELINNGAGPQVVMFLTYEISTTNVALLVVGLSIKYRSTFYNDFAYWAIHDFPMETYVVFECSYRLRTGSLIILDRISHITSSDVENGNAFQVNLLHPFDTILLY